MNPLRFAVIGIGNIGKKHVESISGITAAKLVAVCDIDPDKNDVSIKAKNIKFYTDYKQLIDLQGIDIVCIATPHGLHAQMAIDCMRAGKHVIVEKPMALNSTDCDLMNEVSNQTNKKLFVVKQNRFNLPIIATSEAIEKKKLGQIYLIQCNVFWNRGEEYYSESDWRGINNLEGGALYTQVSHFIDLFILWFGDINEANTIIDTLHHKIEIEDTGVSSIRFKSGILGTLAWTNNVYNKNFEGSITIIGEKGTIKIGGKYLNEIEYWDVKSYPKPINGDLIEKVNDYGTYQGSSSNHNKMFIEIIGNFIESRKGVVEGNEGKQTIIATELIYG
jgi:UDP-N-acetyl-2-amino-2-deoxyglucuronate dehydrogenase